MIQKFAFGVDLGWVSQLEQLGYSWIDQAGKAVDPIAECRNMGANAVRLRVFVDPPREGFWQKNENERCMLGLCDTLSVLAVATRVKALGMDLMLDFHYSDHFADPQRQDVPRAWRDLDDQAMTEKVYAHTKQVLTMFREAQVIPKWVQVGNEINYGLLWPHGSLEKAPVPLIEFLNAGYDAVKEVLPDCQVVTHIAGVHSEEWCVPFLDHFIGHYGKTDVIGFSYYPYWYQSVSKKETLLGWLRRYAEKCQKPLMIAEVGGEDSDEDGTYRLICDSVEALMELPDGQGLGVFYWEPEVNREVLPDRYPLGAARLVGDHVLQYTRAMTAYGRYHGKARRDLS